MNIQEVLKDRGIPQRKEYSIKEVCVLTQLSHVWVRRSITTKKRPSRKVPNERGVLVWRMKHEVLVQWLKDLEEKDQRKKDRLNNYTFERRPSEMSCNMMKRKVSSDTTLTQEQKDIFLSRIEIYRKTWRKEYELRQKK